MNKTKRILMVGVIAGVEVGWGIVRLWRKAVKAPPAKWKVVVRGGESR